MARIKVKHDKNYTIVQNDFIYDKELSTFDKGLLLVMLSKKDDYNFSIDRISKEIGETRQKVSKSLKAIENAGYLSRKQKINNSKFGEMIYYVSDVPCLKNVSAESGTANNSESSMLDKRSTEISTTENAVTENCMTADEVPLLNTDSSRTNKSNTEIINKAPIQKQRKKKYAEAVYMTETEYQTLCEKHSKTFADKCVEVLNNYKLSKGKFYKSDYHAILNWVEKKVVEDFSLIKKPVPIQTNPYENPFTKYLIESDGV